MNSDTVLDVRGLSKRFTLHLRGGAELPVLDELSFTVGRGECVALLGASGHGKSTLIKCLYGSYEPDGGEMLLRGDGWHCGAATSPTRASSCAWYRACRRSMWWPNACSMPTRRWPTSMTTTRCTPRSSTRASGQPSCCTD
jgi:ABC-type glutathione transport system ATPase component